MTEYITKEQALEAIKGKMWPGELEASIKAIPAVDVAPAVHGEWKFVAGPNEDNNIQVMCSNCGAGDLQAVDVTVPYCWKCGARMDGGESNG